MRHDIETVKKYYANVSESTLNAIIKQFVKKINWQNPGIQGEAIIECGGKDLGTYTLNVDEPYLIVSNCFTAITVPDE